MNLLNTIINVRAECGPVIKDSKNPFHQNTYASLNAVLDSVEPIMKKHGVGIFQIVKGRELLTRIATLNLPIAESVESIYPLPVTEDPQKFASAITYARRYSIITMIGLQVEDDDGNRAASLPLAALPTPKNAPQAPKPVTPKSIMVPKEIPAKAQMEAFKAGQLPAFQAGGIDASSSESYVCQFGKWKGSSIDAIINEHGLESLMNYVSFIRGKAESENKPLKGSVKEFIDAAQLIADDRTSFDPNSFNQPMGDFNSDDGKL